MKAHLMLSMREKQHAALFHFIAPGLEKTAAVGDTFALDKDFTAPRRSAAPQRAFHFSRQIPKIRIGYREIVYYRCCLAAPALAFERDMHRTFLSRLSDGICIGLKRFTIIPYTVVRHKALERVAPIFHHHSTVILKIHLWSL